MQLATRPTQTRPSNSRAIVSYTLALLQSRIGIDGEQAECPNHLEAALDYHYAALGGALTLRESLCVEIDQGHHQPPTIGDACNYAASLLEQHGKRIAAVHQHVEQTQTAKIGPDHG